MGDFKIEIRASGGHGCDRTAKAGEPLAPPCESTSCPDCIARRFVKTFNGGAMQSATLTHWPTYTPIVDDLVAEKRVFASFQACQPDDEPTLQWFTFGHLPPALQAISRPFAEMAYSFLALPRCAERAVALRKLLECKDAAVRAATLKK